MNPRNRPLRGRYSFVPIGDYTAIVTAHGFQTLRQSDLRLAAGQALQITLTLSGFPHWTCTKQESPRGNTGVK